MFEIDSTFIQIPEKHSGEKTIQVGEKKHMLAMMHFGAYLILRSAPQLCTCDDQKGKSIPVNWQAIKLQVSEYFTAMASKNSNEPPEWDSCNDNHTRVGGQNDILSKHTKT